MKSSVAKWFAVTAFITGMTCVSDARSAVIFGGEITPWSSYLGQTEFQIHMMSHSDSFWDAPHISEMRIYGPLCMYDPPWGQTWTEEICSPDMLFATDTWPPFHAHVIQSFWYGGEQWCARALHSYWLWLDVSVRYGEQFVTPPATCRTNPWFR